MTHTLTHIDVEGHPSMVDVSKKRVTRREAVAEALVRFPEEAWAILSANAFQTKKGAVADVARIAGVMAAKRTAEWIPFCHTLPLERCQLTVEPLPEARSFRVQCAVATEAKTGVEMEALTGATAAALTLYDMTKSLNHGIVIEHIRLLAKTGGKSDFQGR